MSCVGGGNHFPGSCGSKAPLDELNNLEILETEEKS